MQRLTIETNSIANTKFLAAFLRNVKIIKNVVIEPAAEAKTDSVQEPAEPYNWTNPSRPATEEEFEQLAMDMEQDKGEYSSEDVRNFVNKELKVWRKKNR